MTGQLRHTVAAEPPGTVVRLTGVLDMMTSFRVRDVLRKALSAHPEAIAVDVSGLEIVDTVALTVFTAFARAAHAWPGCRTLLYAPDAGQRAVLDRLAVTRAAPAHARWQDLLDDAAAFRPPRRYRCRLARAPQAVRTARDLVRNVCAEWEFGSLAADAERVATELVSNAVRHACGDILFMVVVGGRYLHISVRDGSGEVPRLDPSEPDSVAAGRGLMIVDAVAHGWGITPTGDGKVVWATLRLG